MMNDKSRMRVDQLHELGLIFNGQECCKEDFNVHWTEILCDSDEVFNKKVESIRTEMIRRSQ